MCDKNNNNNNKKDIIHIYFYASVYLKNIL